jgi:hypothetical protein
VPRRIWCSVPNHRLTFYARSFGSLLADILASANLERFTSKVNGIHGAALGVLAAHMVPFLTQIDIRAAQGRQIIDAANKDAAFAVVRDKKYLLPASSLLF